MGDCKSVTERVGVLPCRFMRKQETDAQASEPETHEHILV